MIVPAEITLSRAQRADGPLLGNLLELYIHDLSEIFPVELGSDGRFGYGKLPLYLTEPERRFAFLIHCAGQIAGFALVTRGSPATENRDDLDVAEFFVLRRHRRGGVGRRAATLLWDRMPGHWVVRVSEANRPGVPFWRAVVGEYTGGSYRESTRPGSPHAWRVLEFDSVIPAEAG